MKVSQAHSGRAKGRDAMSLGHQALGPASFIITYGRFWLGIDHLAIFDQTFPLVCC
jgi:hypothetical protein